MFRKSLLACALAAATLPALATELTFEVAGVEGAEGQVMVALYDEAGYLRKPLKGVRLAPGGKTVSGTFGEVPSGFYAVIAFHDENANGKLDRNLIGIPIERLGYSNNAKGMMGPASFADAKVEVNGASKAVRVTLD
jgi:uncharacterized protein (DUF2141 family)